MLPHSEAARYTGSQPGRLLRLKLRLPLELEPVQACFLGSFADGLFFVRALSGLKAHGESWLGYPRAANISSVPRRGAIAQVPLPPL